MAPLSVRLGARPAPATAIWTWLLLLVLLLALAIHAARNRIDDDWATLAIDLPWAGPRWRSWVWRFARFEPGGRDQGAGRAVRHAGRLDRRRPGPRRGRARRRPRAVVQPERAHRADRRDGPGLGRGRPDAAGPDGGRARGPRGRPGGRGAVPRRVRVALRAGNRALRLALRPPGPATLWIDGRPVVRIPPAPEAEPIIGVDRGHYRESTAHLGRGFHRLDVWYPAGSAPRPRWRLPYAEHALRLLPAHHLLGGMPRRTTG